MTPTIHADAQDWLATQPSGIAKIVVYDPPYAVGTPVRGKEDGAAGSVFGPFSFLSRTLTECARVLMPGGIVMIFADWRRMPDLAYIASTAGLRPSTCLAWVRNRPGTGGLFRSSWDPILIVARGVPDAVDRAAVRNVVMADYPSKRKHPYEKPAELFRHVFPRICKPGDLVLDPFAGSGVSRKVAEELGLRWAGCDIDPAYVFEPSAVAGGDGLVEDLQCQGTSVECPGAIGQELDGLSESVAGDKAGFNGTVREHGVNQKEVESP